MTHKCPQLSSSLSYYPGLLQWSPQPTNLQITMRSILMHPGYTYKRLAFLFIKPGVFYLPSFFQRSLSYRLINYIFVCLFQTLIFLLLSPLCSIETSFSSHKNSIPKVLTCTLGFCLSPISLKCHSFKELWHLTMCWLPHLSFQLHVLLSDCFPKACQIFLSK